MVQKCLFRGRTPPSFPHKKEQAQPITQRSKSSTRYKGLPIRRKLLPPACAEVTAWDLASLNDDPVCYPKNAYFEPCRKSLQVTRQDYISNIIQPGSKTCDVRHRAQFIFFFYFLLFPHFVNTLYSRSSQV